MNQENLGAASIANEESSYNYVTNPYAPAQKRCPTNIYYAVTITPALRANSSYEQFLAPYKRLKRFSFLKQVWEFTKDQKLHTHILAEGPSDIRYKLIHIYGWHIHIDPIITDVEKQRWENYLNKSAQTDVLLHNQINTDGCIFFD